MDLCSSNKYQAIREVIHRTTVFSDVENLQHFEDAVLRRERLQSTGLGRGVALAHGEAKGVKKLSVALGISKEGIRFDSVDTVPVHFLFIIAAPLNSKTDYLCTLSALVRLLRDECFRNSLLNIGHSKVIEHTIRQAFYRSLQRLMPKP